MMQLSSMSKVVATVNSEWKSTLAEEIVKRWSYDEGSVYYFRASANFLFVFRKEGQRYFLRFVEDTQKSFQEIEAEIKILSYLSNHSIKVAEPVLSINENYIEIVETEMGTFYAVVFKAVEGKQYDIDEINHDQFFLWGKSLGQLHQAFKEMPEEFRIKRPCWNEHLTFVLDTVPKYETAVLMEWEKVHKWANKLPITKDHFGMIHYDFELDNLSFMEDEVGILDFDDCANYWYAADLAFALRDLFKDSFDSSDLSYQQFLKGYISETEIQEELLKDLPWFLRMHKLSVFAKLLKVVDIPEIQEGPDWLIGLRNKLVTHINQYRLSLEKKSVL